MLRSKKPQQVLFLVLMIFWLFSPGNKLNAQETEEKYTVYVIANMDGFPNFPLNAYLINGVNIIQAESWLTPRRAGGPVGLAVDDDNSRLYVSYEVAGDIDVFNARTLTPVDDPANPGNPLRITLPGASNIAGMVVSELKGRLYAINRSDTQLYVYDTSNFQRITAEEFILNSGAVGIDVWGDILYVTDYSSTIRYYSLTTGLELGNFTITSDSGAAAIAVDGSDPANVTVFTTRTTQTTFDGRMVKYNINTGTESFVQLGADGRGVSIHPTLGLVYVACSESPSDHNSTIRSYDQATLTLQDSQIMGGSSYTSTDVIASRIQFGGSVSKTCTSHPGGIANVGDTIVYEISVTNNSTAPIDVLPIQDEYDTSLLKFLSSTVPPDDTINDGVINWADLTTTKGNVPVDGSVTFTVRFRAVAATNDASNIVRMVGAKDTFGSSIPDSAGLSSIIIEEPVTFILTVSAGPGGTTNPAPGKYKKEIGSKIPVTAIPDEHYFFCGWSGDIQAGAENENPIILKIESDTTITASFCRMIYCVLDPEGKKILNRSLSQDEYIINLTWEPNPDNVNIVSYRVYLIEGETSTLVQEADTSVLSYQKRGVVKDKLYTYEVVCVNDEGREGCRQTIVVQ